MPQHCCFIRRSAGGTLNVTGHRSGGEPPLPAHGSIGPSTKDRPLPLNSAVQKIYTEPREATPYERIKQSMSVLDEPGNEDEFEKFVNSPPRPMTTRTPLEWWCREEQRIEYPRLHQLAIDVLSVPAMSDDPERVFSCARRTISWDRSRLTADTIEKLQCMSNWVRNDLIRKVYVSVDDDVIEVGGDDKISGASDLYS